MADIGTILSNSNNPAYNFTGGNNSAAPSINNPKDWLSNVFTGNTDFARQAYLTQAQINANNAMQNRDFSFYSSEWAKDRDFKKEQTSTEYLRAADQLRQLGINPAILAYGNAGAASSAPGSSGSGGSHHASGSSWSGDSSQSFGSVLKLISSLANVAAVAFTKKPVVVSQKPVFVRRR